MLTGEEASLFRSALGLILYVSHDRPDISFATDAGYMDVLPLHESDGSSQAFGPVLVRNRACWFDVEKM